MTYANLRVLGPSVTAIPEKIGDPIHLKEPGSGFIVIALSEPLFAILQHGEINSLSVGDILILQDSEDCCLLTEAGSTEITKKAEGILPPKSLDEPTSIKDLSPDLLRRLLSPGSRNADCVKIGDVPAVTDRSGIVATVLSVEVCEILKGGIGEFFPDSLHLKIDESSRNHITSIAEQLTRFTDSTAEIDAARLSRLTELVLIEAIDLFLKEHPLREQYLKGASDLRIRNVLKAVHADPQHAWTVTELASVANMSRSLFAERFRNSMNETPLNYVRQCRIQKAKVLLAESTVPLVQVAQECGYSSQSAFIKAFLKLTGSSPKEWRIRYKSIQTPPRSDKTIRQSRSSLNRRPQNTARLRHP